MNQDHVRWGLQVSTIYICMPTEKKRKIVFHFFFQIFIVTSERKNK